MPNVPGLRSPYSKVGRLVYFGRMLDKIRLHAAGKLPADYVDNLGDQKPGIFDTRCCKFLKVPYDTIKKRTLEGYTDESVLAWIEETLGKRNDEDCKDWNAIMMKRGWHDSADVLGRLQQRIKESGLEGKPIETFFDYIEFDEGRDSVTPRLWESI
jgi:hypothetical protein